MAEREDTATVQLVYRAIGELEKLVNSKFDTVTEQLKPLQQVTNDVEDLKIRMVAAELHQRSTGRRVQDLETESTQRQERERREREARASETRQWWRQHAPGLALGMCALIVAVAGLLH